MEQKEKKEEDTHISNIVNPIFNKVLQEMPFNHSMVGLAKKPSKKTVTPSLYNPHNYRLYFKFTKDNFTPKQGMVGVWFGKFKNYGKEFTAVGEGIRVTVKKKQVEVINKLSEQEWFYVNRIKAKEEITAILNKIDAKCVSSLKKFIEIYGGTTDFIILRADGRPNLNLFTKSDNKVMQEPFIDKIPLNTTFDTNVVKKVYKEPNVEFKEGIYAANYLENSALNEFSPELSKSLSNVFLQLSQLNKELIPSIKELKQAIQLEISNKQLHMGVLNDMKRTLKKICSRLSQTSLTKWL